MLALVRELRVAVRSLARQPGFALVAVLTLALGTGATTAIFTVVYGVLLRPLPYSESDRLVSVWQTTRSNPGGNEGGSVSHVNFLDWTREARSFESMALYSRSTMVLTGLGDAEVVPGAVVTPEFFRVFRASPVLGRTFLHEEDRPGAPPVVMVGDGFWRERLGGRRDVLGQTIEISGRPYQVVGVAPPGFDFPTRARLWVPVKNDDARCGRDCVYLNGIARLAPGVDVESAHREVQALALNLERAFPDTNTDTTAAVASLQDEVVGSVRPALLVLLGAVAMVLLIACANVANLVLVRGTSRRADTAVRAALGAGRLRLVAHLFTENLLLAATGGALGLMLAWWGVDLLKLASPANLPRLDEVSVDLTVFLFVLGLAALTSVSFGLGPALHLSRARIAQVLVGRGEAASRRTRWGRSALLVGEVGFSLMLLVGAGLLLRSLAQLQAVEPGFRAGGLTIFTLSVPSARYPSDADVVRAVEEIDARLGTIPGVRAVAHINGLPLGPSENVFSFTRPDRPAPRPGQAPTALFRVVDPEYFRTMSIPLLSGRSFENSDRETNRHVAVISRRMAERFWKDEDPVGKEIEVGNATGRAMIVGVVADVRSSSLAGQPEPELYVPYAQSAIRSATFVLASDVASGQVLSAARAVLGKLDPKLPLIRPGTMQELVDAQMARPRFYLLLLALFAVLAVTLASVGLYGVVAYTILQRRREIGIRMALGAGRAEVVRLVAWEGARPALAGIALGLAGGFALTRLMAQLLFEVKPADPLTFAGTTALVLLVVLLACVIPARRATRVAPSSALRAE